VKGWLSPERWYISGSIDETEVQLAMKDVVCIIATNNDGIKNGDQELTLRAAAAAATRSSRAFSVCLRFLRRVSGTSMSYIPVIDRGNQVQGSATSPSESCVHTRN
jgi:hypothetical protein